MSPSSLHPQGRSVKQESRVPQEVLFFILSHLTQHWSNSKADFISEVFDWQKLLSWHCLCSHPSNLGPILRFSTPSPSGWGFLSCTPCSRINSSNAFSTVQSLMSDSAALWIAACQAPLSMGFSRSRSTGVGCHALLQGIFPTQGSNLSPILTLSQTQILSKNQTWMKGQTKVVF